MKRRHLFTLSLSQKSGEPNLFRSHFLSLFSSHFQNDSLFIILPPLFTLSTFSLSQNSHHKIFSKYHFKISLKQTLNIIIKLYKDFSRLEQFQVIHRHKCWQHSLPHFWGSKAEFHDAESSHRTTTFQPQR